MDNNKFINKLMEALEDESVRAKINSITKEKEIISNNDESDIKDYEHDNSLNEKLQLEKYNDDLKKEIEEYKKKFELAQKEISNYKFEKNELSKKLRNEEMKMSVLIKENEAFNKKIQIYCEQIEFKDTEIVELNRRENKITEEFIKVKKYYEDMFSVMLNKYKCYLSLREGIRLELTSVINCRSVELFLISGSQWENIEALWQFISYKINEYEKMEILNLTEVFEYFFSRYNEIHNMYKILDVNIGEEFDEDLHSRGEDSRVSGKISEINLLGYKNIRTDKIIQKSIVRVL